MDRENRIWEAVKRVEVQQALNAYHQAVSHMDLDAILETYASDGVWELDLGYDQLRFSGAEDLRRGYQKVFIDESLKFDPPQGPEVQLNAPATISFRDGKAYAHSVMMVVLRPHGGQSNAVTGFYDDVLRRADDDWKFERRSFTLNFMWQGAAPPVAPPA